MCPPEIEVACHNGSDSSTISGPAVAMKEFVAHLTSKGIFAKEVPCSNIAYHSRYISKAGKYLIRKVILLKLIYVIAFIVLNNIFFKVLAYLNT